MLARPRSTRITSIQNLSKIASASYHASPPTRSKFAYKKFQTIDGEIHFGTIDRRTHAQHLERLRRMSGEPPYNDLTYYTFGTPNGLKPAIVLEELGCKYKCEKIDIMENTQKEQWFLDINPNGRIPALTDGKLRVFESGAIMMYLTEQYDKENTISYKYATTDHYEMLSWLMFQMGGIGPMQGLWSFLSAENQKKDCMLIQISLHRTSKSLPCHGRCPL